jgi:hypothetical protein
VLQVSRPSRTGRPVVPEDTRQVARPPRGDEKPPASAVGVCHVLIPLAGLVHLRFTQLRLSGEMATFAGQQPSNPTKRDFIAGLRVVAPVAATLFASAGSWSASGKRRMPGSC